MRKKRITFWLSSSIILLGLFFNGQQKVYADQVQILTPVDMEMSFADLESLEAEFNQSNNIVSVKGRIKNTSSSIMRGYLSLHLLSPTGSVLQSFELPIKSHQPLNRGESVKFETVLPITNGKGATQVSVDFTRD